jgi:hypothetical protein
MGATGGPHSRQIRRVASFRESRTFTSLERTTIGELRNREIFEILYVNDDMIMALSAATLIYADGLAL